MAQDLKDNIKVLKDPKKRREFEKALLKAGAEYARKRAHEVAEKLNDKVQENWPEVKEKVRESWSETKQNVRENWPKVKQHTQNLVKDLPNKAKIDIVIVGEVAKNLLKSAFKNKTNTAFTIFTLSFLLSCGIYLNNAEEIKLKREIRKEKKRLNLLEDKLNQRHQITDMESFDQLFNEALPLVQVSLLTSEVYISNPYTDNGAVINTVGIGSWWYPENGEPTSSKWVKTSEYVKTHPDLSVDGNQAMNMVKGWMLNREDKRIYNMIYKNLLGKDITLKEYLKLVEVIYNSERAGKKLNEEVFKNGDYKDPFKLANCMMNLKYDQKFENGLLRRNAAQSADIIAGIDHCTLHIKRIVQKNKSDVYVTSVSVLPLSLCKEFKAALDTGNNQKAKELSQQIKFKMEHWLCRNDNNGQSAIRQVQKIVTDTAIANPICRFAGDTLNATGDSPYWGDVLYDQAREYTECGMYDKAAKCYEDLFAKGFYGADLYLDAARNYYEMGDYKKCREQCRKAINGTLETHQTLPAYKLAVDACQAMGDVHGAELNQRKVTSLTK